MADDHLSKEVWKPVVGYEGLYGVSNHGNVRSLDRFVTDKNGIKKRRKGQPLKPILQKRGYMAVGIGGTKYIHRLVLEAFVGPCPEGMETCHNNGVRTDNRLENLRWDTSSANNDDIVKHGRHWLASRSHCPRGHALKHPNLLSGKARGRECLACARAKSFERNHPEIDLDFQAYSDMKYAEIIEDAKDGRFSRQNKHKKVCKRGHVLELPNLEVKKFTKSGHRTCYACNRAGNELRHLGISSEAELQKASDLKYQEITRGSHLALAG